MTELIPFAASALIDEGIASKIAFTSAAVSAIYRPPFSVRAWQLPVIAIEVLAESAPTNATRARDRGGFNPSRARLSILELAPCTAAGPAV
jgi:hypothetical protein